MHVVRGIVRTVVGAGLLFYGINGYNEWHSSKSIYGRMLPLIEASATRRLLGSSNRGRVNFSYSMPLSDVRIASTAALAETVKGELTQLDHSNATTWDRCVKEKYLVLMLSYESKETAKQIRTIQTFSPNEDCDLKSRVLGFLKSGSTEEISFGAGTLLFLAGILNLIKSLRRNDD